METETIDLAQEDNDEEFKMPVCPKSSALKAIGLSMIKMQYGDRKIKSKSALTASTNKPVTWTTLWEEDSNALDIQYPLRHLLEHRQDKGCRCPCFRSVFCQNYGKMSQISQIYHIRRGHMRINAYWRRALVNKMSKSSGKGGNGYGCLFQLACILCSSKRKFIPLTVKEFLNHMKRHHPSFMPFNDFFSYFQRCFICNQETKSLMDNILHRQNCSALLARDPNNSVSTNFNVCFKRLQRRKISCLDYNSKFESKLKSFTDFRRSALFAYVHGKRTDLRKISQQRNGFAVPRQVIPSKPFLKLKERIVTSLPLNKGLTFNLSDRIVPGNPCMSALKTFVPIPYAPESVVHVWPKEVKLNDRQISCYNTFICEICNAMLKNRVTMFSHIKMCHPGVHMIENSCKSCNKLFITMEGYRNHFKISKRCPVSRRCGICNMGLAINDIYEHLYQEHKSTFDKVLDFRSCLICRNQVDNIVSHLFDVHGFSNILPFQDGVGILNYRNGAFFNCIKCSFTFLSEVELRNHIIATGHTFDCVFCPSKFYLAYERMEHLIELHKIHESRRLICELCSNGTATNDDGSEMREIPTFGLASEKIKHFLQEHARNCHVVLETLDSKMIPSC